MIDASGWKEPPLELSGCERMNVIVYQLALVSRKCSGNPGREVCACGPVCSLAEVVAARLIGPFVSKHAAGGGREKEGYREGKEEEGRGQRGEEGKGDREEKGG